MKKYFYFSLFALLVFEVLNVYFIMPMPGSQNISSIYVAYFLYSNRWMARIIFFILLLIGTPAAFRVRYKWLPVLLLVILGGVIYQFNFQLVADKIFLSANRPVMKTYTENKLADERQVIAVENKSEAKAYPIMFLAYHHQIPDSLGGKPILVTYCNVCRSGRVYEPIVNGHYETFRLVGMDHYNAMFEDASTGSWWRQATGEAVTGKLKGSVLRELESRQMSIEVFYQLYPKGLVMQADKNFISKYDSLARFELGKSKGELTHSDTGSWKNKSWILGLRLGTTFKAYDWKDLKRVRVLNDSIESRPLVVILASDNKTFVAFERPSNDLCQLKGDTLFCGNNTYDLLGKNLKEETMRLKNIVVYQEFWHSWATFHPNTKQYRNQ